MLQRLEQIAGAALILLALVDVFLTVLYARLGTAVLSTRLSRLEWRIFRNVAWRSGRQRGKVLSFCAPIILVSLVGVWAMLLAVGMALVIHPALGSAVQATAGATPRDFMTALFAGGSSLSFISVANLEPKTAPYKLLYLFSSLVGMSVLSLTITYLMQLYNGVRERNTFGLKLHLLSAETNDAVEIVAGMAARGRFDATYSAFAEIGAEAVKVKESHQFYPVLVFFRFRQPYYGWASAILQCLDCVTLIKSALDDEQFGWVKESAALTQIWRAAILSTKLLDEAERHHGEAKHGEEPDEETRERWRRRYHAAVRRLREAGVKTYADEAVGAEIYASLRAEWDHRLQVVAPAMGYTMKEIDPAGHDPETTDRLPAFEKRLTGVE
ncbi:MAG: two pore domain potassium channel family protein [Gemmatimonadaceae bacterium]|nr:two pore domain potassium channel family protein [Gemmatimonadaceae bacterium]